MASRLKSTKKYLVAVLLPKATPEIPFWNDHVIGINQAEKEVSTFDVYTQIFYFDQNSEPSFFERVDEIILNKFDGVFMVPVFYEDSLRLIKNCQEQSVPCLLFDTNFPDQDQVSFIGQNAYDSGFLAAELLDHCLPAGSTILIANIVKEHDNHLQFEKREAGFRAFFAQHLYAKSVDIIKLETRQGITKGFEQELAELLRTTNKLKGIFTINGVQQVASVVDQHNWRDLKIVGYDIIPETVHYLQKSVIDFIISQQPKMQAYEGIKLLYENLLLKKPLKLRYYLPIDIVMKSNLKYYTQ